MYCRFHVSGGQPESVLRSSAREMLVRYNARGEAATTVARLGKAALERGLCLMKHWNMVMVVPRLTIMRDDVDEIAIHDDAHSIADEYAP